MSNLRPNKAFTLAEVLITLGIIGIVAALTIPTLMQNQQKTQYVTRLKKAYAEVNQALISLASDNGCAGSLKCTGLFAGNSQQVGAQLVKYFKTAKDCDTTTTGCMSDSVSQNYDGSGARASSDGLSTYRFTTVNGMSYAIFSWSSNCGSDADGYSNHITYNLKEVCGLCIVDVNGLKLPNNVGRDIFYFYITNGKGPSLYPQGGVDESYNLDGPWITGSTPNTCYSGYTWAQQCSARIMEEGWEMNY